MCVCVCVGGGGGGGGGRGVAAMNMIIVDNKKKITNLKSQCRDPGAPQLYEGKSHDHQRSLLE